MNRARYVLDACVLYPTVLREILLGLAADGAFAPVWSPRLLEEWRRTAERQGGAPDRMLAEAEIARMTRDFPEAEVTHDPAVEAQFWLPDPADIHVLATAHAAGAAGIVTFNLRDFPAREMAGIAAIHPDAFLRAAWLAAPEQVAAVVDRVHATAQELAGEAIDRRKMLKRLRLPRLAKAMLSKS